MHLRQIGWEWQVGAGILAFNALLFLYLLVHPGSFLVNRSVDDLAGIIGPLIVVGLCFGGRAGLRDLFRREAGAQRVIGADLLGLGVLAYVIGWSLFAYYALILQRDMPYPSIADATSLANYPLSLAGILALPRRRLSGTARSRVLLDSLMVLGACVTFSWYFILGPNVLAGGETLLSRLVSTAYPLGDILLLICLLVIWADSRDASDNRGRTILSIGLGILIFSDVAFDYQMLQGTYSAVSGWDAGFPLAEMVICLGVGMLRQTRKTAALPRAALADVRPLWQAMLPYGLLVCVMGLVVALRFLPGDASLRAGVYVGAALLVVLVFVRQIATILENRRLYQHLSGAFARVQEQNVALEQVNERLESLATTDPLTDLPNHRAMHSAVAHEIERSRRYGRQCAMLFIDLDHFKALNDAYGHATGDDALHEFGSVLRRSVRSVDTVGRWGGEEFVIVLPETDGERALQTGEQVRARIAEHVFTSAGGAHLTCSLGAAAYPGDAETTEALIQAADSAMYAAKNLGRNQVRWISDPVVAALGRETSSDSRDDLTLSGVVEALASLVQARDTYTTQHSEEVGALSTRLALALGLEASQARMVGLAGRLHDIGKVVVPDAILNKPGPLTEAEWTAIRRHPVVGAEVIAHVPSLRPLSPAIRAHHERWDGAGYPDGLSGDRIPLAARILAVTDAYAAMTSQRPYREALPPEVALREVHRCSGTQFDPAVVAALDRVVASSSLDARSA